MDRQSPRPPFAVIALRHQVRAPRYSKRRGLRRKQDMAVHPRAPLGSQSDVESVQQVASVLYRVLPDLESFNLTIEALHGLPVAPADVWWPMLYGLVYSVIVLMAGSFVFHRKDFR